MFTPVSILFLQGLVAMVMGESADVTKEKVEHVVPHSAMHQQHYRSDGVHNVEYDHEAVLGSRDLDKEFASLSSSVAKERLGNLVDRMDTDANGFISHKELSAWVYKSFTLLDEEEALQKLSEHDKNKDGNVSWPEYLEKVYGYLPQEIEDMEHDKNMQVITLTQMIFLDKEKFAAADVNHDGVLDHSEYPAFMHPYDFEYMHHVELKRILRDYDKNGDKAINLKEFMQEEDFPMERNPELDLVDKENFESYDLNQNGLLEEAEIKLWAIPDHLETAQEEAEHLIEETDRNHDGQLSKREIIGRHKLWVGSSATDFGRQLHDSSEL